MRGDSREKLTSLLFRFSLLFPPAINHVIQILGVVGSNWLKQLVRC